MLFRSGRDPLRHGEGPAPVAERLGRRKQVDGKRVVNAGSDAILLELGTQLVAQRGSYHILVVDMFAPGRLPGQDQPGIGQ